MRIWVSSFWESFQNIVLPQRKLGKFDKSNLNIYSRNFIRITGFFFSFSLFVIDVLKSKSWFCFIANREKNWLTDIKKKILEHRNQIVYLWDTKKTNSDLFIRFYIVKQPAKGISINLWQSCFYFSLQLKLKSKIIKKNGRSKIREMQTIESDFCSHFCWLRFFPKKTFEIFLLCVFVVHTTFIVQSDKKPVWDSRSTSERKV